MAYYITKKPGGIAVWLKRRGPAITWGPKDQAIKFKSKGEARLTLSILPKAENAEVETDDDETPKP